MDWLSRSDAVLLAVAAYVAVMGTTDIAKVDLRTFGVDWITGVGSGPRHLSISPNDRFLYVTLNGADVVAKVNVDQGVVVRTVSTGDAPRSMAIADDGKSLYVVNYYSNTVAKVRARDLEILQTELLLAQQLLGCPTPADIGRAHVARRAETQGRTMPSKSAG